MSRLIKKTILIPENVKVSINEKEIVFSGPLGELILKRVPNVDVVIQNNEIQIPKTSDSKQFKMMSGTMWALIKNAISGVSSGFQKILEIEGIGYRAEINGKNLTLYLGFSHPVNIPIPEDLKVKAEKNQILISGINKELVGKFAALIRGLKPPEPYKGKGIHYQGEYIRRKAGKKAGSS
ncbi:MAG: 50S ribosomal protein L6 [Minisyncoccia bacterium]